MIEMNHVHKSFGDHTVLADVSFTVEDRKIFGLLGPSGAGKTTIINILTGQLEPDAGAHRMGAAPSDVGLMLDEDGLYVRLTCKENLAVYATIYGLDKVAPMVALRSVGLADSANRPVSQLSSGMRQRLALARAILHRPKVLFLDEPTSGLDPSTARGIHKLILAQRDQGATIFLTTHNMGEAVDLCDEVALLNQGHIVEHGTPADICRRHHAIKTVPDLEAVFLEMTGATLP